MNKNYGEGQLYDMRRPISIDMTTRPRPFNDIPAEHNLAFFIEEASKLRLGKHRIDITAGLRSAISITVTSSMEKSISTLV